MPKIMLVEDDNNLREIYSARLQAEGYDIVSAKDGEEALVVAKAETPDLVISDVMMPKISGFEMLDILRNTDGLKDVKVIMLTALGQSDDQDRADRLGADKYLVKSQVTLEDIVKTTHSLLGDTDQPAPMEAAEPAAAVPAVPVTPDPIAITPAPVVEVAAVPPAPEPVAVPISEPVLATPPPTDDQDDVQSTAQEEADIEAKIEDFVAGATSEPTAPLSPHDITPPPDTDTASAPEPVAASTPTPPVDVPVPPAPEPVLVEPTETATRKVITPLGSDGAPQKDINELLALEEAQQAASAPPPAPTAVIASNEAGVQTQPLEVPIPVPPTPTVQTPEASTEDKDKPDPNSIAL